MDKFKYKEITVEVYTDVSEFAEKLYAPPEGAILDTESLPNDAGFSCITTNTIAIWKTKIASFDELLSTVSHEIGHLITGGFETNPPLDEKYDDLHEEKAEHYETFALDSYNIAKIIYADTFKEMGFVQCYHSEAAVCRICGGQMENKESGMCRNCWDMYDTEAN